MTKECLIAGTAMVAECVPPFGFVFVIQYFPVRLFVLDPIRACSVVNKVEKLDRKQNSSFRLAPFAASGGERGKAETCATESGSHC
jgi:hypothetical protein